MPHSPQQKKRLDYDHQRRGFSEYAHALRHGKWRKKRRSVQKSERRAVAIVLHNARGAHGDLDSGEIDTGHVFRKRIVKWGASNLKDWVEGRLDGRTRRFAWNLFKEPYVSERHRHRFDAVLQDLTASKAKRVLPMARRFRLLLDLLASLESPMAAHKNGRIFQRLETEVEWLRHFFADEPMWSARLRAWVNQILAINADE